MPRKLLAARREHNYRPVAERDHPVLPAGAIHIHGGDGRVRKRGGVRRQLRLRDRAAVSVEECERVTDAGTAAEHLTERNSNHAVRRVERAQAARPVVSAPPPHDNALSASMRTHVAARRDGRQQDAAGT